MAFQILYPDTQLKINVSSTPAIKTVFDASSVVISNATNISSHIYANEISVANTTNNTKSIMDDGSVYCADTDTGTSARIYQQGKLLINETLAANSFMDASGISFVNASATARLSSVDGVTLSTGAFKPTSILDGSNASGTSGQVLSAGAGGALSWITTTSGFVGTANSNLSMSTYNVNFNDAGLTSLMNVNGIEFDDGTGITSLMNVSGIEFTSNGGTARISTLDGVTLSTGSFQPTSILDGSNASGTSGQVLSAGAGGALSWITPASGSLNPTSDLNMSAYNLTWNGGLAINDDGAGNLKINTSVDLTSGRAFTQKYLPINVNMSGTTTVAYLPLFI